MNKTPRPRTVLPKYKAMGERLGEKLGIKEELIIKACSISLQAHTSTKAKHYVSDKSSDVVVFAFDGFRSINDWMPFGETKIDRTLFPSIRSIGTDDVAVINTAVLARFEAVLKQLKFIDEVEKAMNEKRQIVFAGHSAGGGVAMIITIWFLEKYVRTGLYEKPPRCVTFGSMLIGNWIISHALQRENWADYFVNFVTKYDIVPRMMLTPLSTIEKELRLVIPFKKTLSQISNEASGLFRTVMKNASYVASHVASKLMGCTNPLLETILGFVPLSCYRPFGTYVFSTGNGRLGVVKNSDAVLQMLYYCAQLNSLEECAQVACRSLDEHMIYESELRGSILQMQDVMYLDHLQELPLSSSAGAFPEAEETNNVLNDFGLSARARLCLRAAGEFEKQKLDNQTKIDSKRGSIRKGLSEILQYKQWCESHGITYYDSFKLQKDKKDFEANIARLEVVGIWDELIEMLKRSELPDNFECRKDWIELGTEFRRLVEPLDIANYYRHLKNEDTGAYMARARPKRYRFTQRWREHQLNVPVNTCSETCFLARVEELRVSETNMKEVLKLERDVYDWVHDGELGTDVFMKGSTFVEWWRSLAEQHKHQSCLRTYMSG